MTDDFPEEFGGHTQPFDILKLWFDEAHRTQLKNPDAFTLSTVDSSGQPHSRVLLCKEIRESTLVFYSSYESAKANEIQHQNKASMNFFWDPLHRQVRITGEITKLSHKESAEYWASRERASQLSQWVSKQSQPLENRATMEEAVQKAEDEFKGKDIPCPDHWGGFLMKSSSMEFWVGRSGRFHDRHLFTMVENQWASQRLYP